MTPPEARTSKSRASNDHAHYFPAHVRRADGHAHYVPSGQRFTARVRDVALATDFLVAAPTYARSRRWIRILLSGPCGACHSTNHAALGIGPGSRSRRDRPPRPSCLRRRRERTADPSLRHSYSQQTLYCVTPVFRAPAKRCRLGAQQSACGLGRPTHLTPWP